ncbi:MAG: VTT domain-containing protein [Alphaproteobacteria bacterium]
MGDILHKIIEAVGSNQHLAYALVLVLSFSESLPVLGSFIPGTTIIVTIAALVPSGAVDIWWLLGAAIVGAILGDGFSYWLGHRYHREIANMWPLKRYPQLIGLGQAAFEKHGGKSILIARFTPAIRAIVPLVAGILRMDAWRFYVVNIVSAFAWAIAHIVPAVVVGASLAVAGAVGGRLVVLIVVLAVVLWAIVLLVRLAVRKGLPLLGRGATRLWLWARHHDNWASREVLSLLDPSHHEVKGLLLLVALLIGGTAALLAVVHDMLTGGPIARMDQAVFNFFQDVHTLWADRTMVVLSELGDPVVTAAVVLAAALWLAARGGPRATAYWLGAVAFAALYVVALAFILDLPRIELWRLELPRPTPLEGALNRLDFTAGHTALTGTVYGFLALLIGRELEARGRLALAILTTVLVVLIAFSRVYLGVRWASDVAAGFAFALVWVAGLGLVYLSHRPRQIGAGGFGGVLLFVLAAVGVYHASADFHRDLHRYALRPVIRHVAAAAWWRDGWAALPARRIDLAGGLEEPITLQWAGTLADIKAAFAARGWSEPPPWTLVSALSWLESNADLADLPVLTQLHDGQPARLIMIQPESAVRGPAKRLILRLWRAPIELDTGDARSYHLWLGTVVEQRLYHVGSFLTFGRAVRDESAPRARLEAALPSARTVQRGTAVDRWSWDGWVLLAHDPGLVFPNAEKGAAP